MHPHRLNTPPLPETITISIQPESTDHLNDLASTNNLDITLGNTNSGLSLSNSMVTLRPVESTPNFDRMKVNGNLADALTLNSANSFNSLITRDELNLQHQREQSPDLGSGCSANGLVIGIGPPGGNESDTESPIGHESAISIAIQVVFPFLVAGFGMVAAGLLLDAVQNWSVFINVSEIMVLVPALLGLKGNLEMTLASRLSTQANMGTFDKKADQLQLVAGNMALIECQAIVVGFLASWFAILIGFFTDGQFDINHALLLCASSILTAASASIILGITMVGVIMVSHRCNINPDNVATPIAASLGDVTALAILSGIGTLLFGIIDKMLWVGPLIILLCLCLVPVLVVIVRKNKYTEEVLRTGWLPVISAMIISSIAGFILDEAVSRFKNIAVFQPVINGVGGNLVAIHASRISTSLHKSSEPGCLPPSHSRICIDPCSAFFGKDIHTTTARVLISLVIPGHLIFAYIICYVKTGEASLTFPFVGVYLLSAVIQVAVLLYVSLLWTHWMWSRKLDPDNCSIPYLTAFGDFLGVSLLTVSFLFLDLINESNIGVEV
ncbi:hypothetical protein CHUAL_005174 [Chamberlinius hualienensis]